MNITFFNQTTVAIESIAQTIGRSDLRFANIYSTNLNISGTATFSGSLTVSGSILPAFSPEVKPDYLQYSAKAIAVDASTVRGQHTSTAIIPGDGFPFIAYHDTTALDLRVTKCGNADCSSGNTTTAIDAAAGTPGIYNAVTIGSDGFAKIAYQRADTTNSLKYVSCVNATCSPAPTAITLDTPVAPDTYGNFADIATGADGFAVISHARRGGTTRSIRVTKCASLACSAGTTTNEIVTSTTINFGNTAIAIKADGNPIIAYVEAFGGSPSLNLKIINCNDPACATSSAAINAGTYFPTDSASGDIDMQVRSDGLPVIALFSSSSLPVVIICNDNTCSTPNSYTVASGFEVAPFDTTSYISLALSADKPAIAYYNARTSSLRLTVCSTLTCSSFYGNDIDQGVGITGQYNSLVIPSDGRPFMAYYESVNGDLRAAKCIQLCNSNAYKFNSPTSTIDTQLAGITTGQLVINNAGNSVAAYAITTGIRITGCVDRTCATGNSNVTYDTVAVGSGTVSGAMRNTGFPIFSYYDSVGGDLSVIDCTNVTCGTAPSTAAGTVRDIDTTNNVGQYSSIVMRPSGLPLLFYYDVTNGNLMSRACTNIICSTLGTATTLDSTNNVGREVNAIMRPNGFAFTVYYDETANTVKAFNCSNDACTTGTAFDVGTAVLSGGSPDIAVTLTKDGYPAFIYGEGLNDVYLVVCRSMSCDAKYGPVKVLSAVFQDIDIGLTSEGKLLIIATSPSIISSYVCSDLNCDLTNGVSTSMLSSGASGSSWPFISLAKYAEGENNFLILTARDENAASSDAYPTLLSYRPYQSKGINIGSADKYFNSSYVANTYSKTTNINNFDVAEEYEVDDASIAAGDVVKFKAGKGNLLVDRAGGENQSYDEAVIGVVSTEPGLYLKDWESKKQHGRPIALAGRVPVKVSLENGPIRRGDYLTTASKPGYAMKSTKAGMIVGRAMEDFPQGNISGDSKLVKAEFAADQNQAETLAAQLTESGDLEPEAAQIATDTLAEIAKPLDSEDKSLGRIMMYVDLGYAPATETSAMEAAIAIEQFSLANGNNLFEFSQTENKLTINSDLNTTGKILAPSFATANRDALILQLAGADKSIKFTNSEGELLLSINANGKLNLIETGNGSTGQATLPTNETQIEINNTSVTEQSTIIVAPDQFVNYRISHRETGKGFTIEISAPLDVVTKFDYWLVN
jgi:hypothetical protein